MSNKKRFFGLMARGLGMGAADVVPGVSGGTIAFITGIYEELLETISNLKFSLVRTWRRQGFKAMWTALNGDFLLALFLGISISIISLAKLLEYLLLSHEIPLWSFFFGLILASIWLVGKTVEKWNVQTLLGLTLGVVSAYFTTILSPVAGSESLPYMFLCGSLAISAMILPGISGSFILLLLGVYTTVLGTVSGMIDSFKAKDWVLFLDQGLLMGVFMLGCLFGLIAFSKLLNMLFKRSKNLIISILTGFLIGSLNRIWPWKETTVWALNSHGEEIPLVQTNISPNQFTEITGASNGLGLAVLLMVAGLTIVIVLESIGKKLRQGGEEV